MGKWYTHTYFVKFFFYLLFVIMFAFTHFVLGGPLTKSEQILKGKSLYCRKG